MNVVSVEVRDVLIPPALEDAMSMQAQAERERQARVILGDSEPSSLGPGRRHADEPGRSFGGHALEEAVRVTPRPGPPWWGGARLSNVEVVR